MRKPDPPTQHKRQRDAIAAEQGVAAAEGNAIRACLPQDDGRTWPLPTSAKRLPPLIALSYFEAAARTQSFAAAAKELHVTPAAISHQIKALEEHLGVELFVRHHRKVSLTPATKAALPTLQDGFAALADGVEQIRAQVLTGSVSIDRAAQSMDTSVRTLQRELNRAGTDFRSLASAARIQRATELLRHTKGSITRVSAELGYSSPANFARAFRKATGRGPR